MKKHLLIIMALFIFTAIFASGSRFEVVYWQEDFESGAPGWTSYDSFGSSNNWHLYNNNDVQGNVWWMGNPALASGTNIGGYYNEQYVVLDTPARTLTAANANLTFKLRYKLEATAGATAPYNGWDACNVRVSVNGGPFVSITGTPAYNMTSSYAFGYQHGEGANVPGWGGNLTNWTNASFDLSQYIGSSVVVRFAFASDPGYCTEDDRTLFGMMVDDISFGGYTNNGVDDGQMTWASLVPPIDPGPDLWHIAVVPTAPTPTHAMVCQNANGTYEANMFNYVESPSIQLPSSGDIRADFMAYADFNDLNAFPNVDYFGFEISPDNGVTWFRMSNPYGDPAGSNYVYTGNAATWGLWTESWQQAGIISDYAGETVKFRWLFRADEDAPIGTGFMFDDFKIYNDIFIAAPENLSAVATGSSVTLNWAAPGSGGGGGEEGWIGYCTDTIGSSIGTTSGVADFDVAAKWDALGSVNSIYPYVGMNITKIKFAPMAATATYTLRLWETNAGALVYEQAVPNPVIGEWNEVILTTPYTIPSGTTVLAGYRTVSTAGSPAGCDEGPQVNGYGNMIRWNNVWTTLSALSATFDYNWNIKVYVADAEGREYVMGELPTNFQANSSELVANTVSNRNRDVTAYKIFRNDVFIAEVPGTVLTYTETNVPGGFHTYYTKAVYGTYESLASNTASVFVFPPTYVELSHHDGTSEQGFNVGSTRRMAVKFTHPTPMVLKNAKVYIHNVGTANLILHVFDDSGVDGMPGATYLNQLVTPAANLVQGWNTLTFAQDIPINQGSFYLAILETANASAIGFDTSSNGFSYKKMSATGAWEAITDGEVMINAIFDTASSNEDEVIKPFVLESSNYPNPFNPETTISFTLPVSGATSLKIFNLKGQLVRNLVNADMTAGTQRVVWNGTDDSNKPVSSGLYFYQINNAGKTITKKMLLAK